MMHLIQIIVKWKMKKKIFETLTKMAIYKGKFVRKDFLYTEKLHQIPQIFYEPRIFLCDEYEYIKNLNL